MLGRERVTIAASLTGKTEWPKGKKIAIDYDMRAKIIRIQRDTPVSCPGGNVTILCRKGKYPEPTIRTIIDRSIRCGFCDNKTTFDIEIVKG